MKRLLIILLFLLTLTGCQVRVTAIADYKTLDSLISDKKAGKFTQAVAYDLRAGTDCEAGHIDGFMCIFYYQTFTIDSLLEHVINLYGTTTTIILICEDGQTSSSFATSLQDQGYKNVYYFVGGYREYVNQNKDFTPKVGCEC